MVVAVTDGQHCLSILSDVLLRPINLSSQLLKLLGKEFSFLAESLLQLSLKSLLILFLRVGRGFFFEKHLNNIVKERVLQEFSAVEAIPSEVVVLPVDLWIVTVSLRDLKGVVLFVQLPLNLSLCHILPY